MSRSVGVKERVIEHFRPTPWSELSSLRKVRRGFGFVMFLSSLAMGAAASTAYTDWDITQEDVEKKFG